jgi:glycosyltransferase involved in cell wall biosynthesis
MRVLHIISTLDPREGGPIEGVRQLGSEVENGGEHSVEVATLDAPSAGWLTDFPLKTHALGPAFGKYHFAPKLVSWLGEHCRDYDAVIVNGLWQYGAFATWCVLRRGDVPYFVFPHGMLDPWFKRRYPLKHLKKWLYWPWADYRVLRDARAVLFTCEEERIQARKSFWLYRCREKVVGYGTSAPSGNPQLQQTAFFTRFPELRDRRILLFLGRLHEKKGCDLLIRAFGKVTSDFPSVTPALPLHLVIAGPCSEPSYLHKLQRLSADLCPSSSVSFPGMLSGEVKWGALHASDAFILPSHQENFGIAVAEALACSTPVLISDKVNIWREIQRDRAGLVESDTAEGTEQLLRRWVNMLPGDREQMKRNAWDCFCERFEIRSAAMRLMETLTACTSNPAPPVSTAGAL